MRKPYVIYITHQEFRQMLIMQPSGFKDAIIEIHSMGIFLNPQKQLHQNVSEQIQIIGR